MHLELKVHVRKHNDVVGALGWSPANELYTCGDDHRLLKHNRDELETEVATLPNWYPTSVHWLPSAQAGKKAQGEFMAVGSDDGYFRFVSRQGRVEKAVEAHNGALTSLAWSHDSSALVTAGEDGHIKIWSRSGMLRSVLDKAGVPVYSVAWSPNSDQVLYTSGKNLVIKPLQPSAKTEQWKAHEGLILCVDWNQHNNTIVSAGEDRRYKVWDSFGRILHGGISHDHPITSIKWAPNGSLFAVGSYNTIRLCDRAGWSHALDKPDTGSIYDLAWSEDSTQVACACANGTVVVGGVLNRRVEWGHWTASLVQKDKIEVTDSVANTTEQLDFRDRVVRMSLAFNHLVVTTLTQCIVYKTKQWTTPTFFDLKDSTINVLLQSKKNVLICDSRGIQIYSYEGSTVSTPKLQHMRSDRIKEKTVALNDSTLVVVDQRDEKMIHVIDVQSGKPISKPISHNIAVSEVYIDHTSSFLAIVDQNKDVYVTPSHQTSPKLEKLETMVDSLCWHDDAPMLAILADGRFSVWYNPSTVYIDRSLLERTKTSVDATDYGKSPHILSFGGNRCRIRRADGSLLFSHVSPYPATLHEYVAKRKWEDAVRLCRFAKSESLWACLAALAAKAKELNTAEVAYAALEEVDKVHYIQSVKSIPTIAGRNAEMALFCREMDEAEHILLKAGLIFRAIKMNCNSFNWDRALELAIKHKTHVDTVLALRLRYLQGYKKKETKSKFIEYAKGVEVDWEQIEKKIEAEAEKERTMPGAKPYA